MRATPARAEDLCRSLHELADALRRERRLHRLRGNAEVRGAPHDAALADEQCLRRLMADAKLSRHGVGHVSMRLDGDDGVVHLDAIGVEVIDDLIERLGAYTAAVAVREQQ